MHKSQGAKGQRSIGRNTNFNGSKVKMDIMVMFLGSKVKLVIVKGQLKHCNLEIKL